ncbi:MAG: HAD family hydrolase [Phycisphaerales bacterium]|nr:HAD family hydrolase [Phycisphaerales bacterium]
MELICALADGGDSLHAAAPMKLAVFDIDGTLTATQSLDEQLYQRAIHEVLGVSGISTDWGAYDHSTDEAIVAQIIREKLQRQHSSEEIALVRDRFVDLIQEAGADNFQEITGAQAMLGALASEGWSHAIASGGWSQSACIKLARAGFSGVQPRRELPITEVCGVPAAFAEDGWPRAQIITTAVERARARYGAPSQVVYVGDGSWDVIAARQCGMGCVGIGFGPRADTLRSVGASGVVADYRDLPEFFSALTRAAHQEVS